MQIRHCQSCGSESFTGTVVVTFGNVPVDYDRDQQAYLPDWMEGLASEDEVIAATCHNCGTELRTADEEDRAVDITPKWSALLRTVDITPKWSALLPGMLAVLANPDAPFGSRRLIEQELTRMARAADLYNFIQNEA
jgi:hypothetical protein